jgi:hypothetical protein
VVVRLLETFELVRVLATGGVATAAVVQVGHYVRERARGRNRVAEIRAESDAKLIEIQATSAAEIAKLRAELQLERERNRALTSGALSIGPPPG